MAAFPAGNPDEFHRRRIDMLREKGGRTRCARCRSRMLKPARIRAAHRALLARLSGARRKQQHAVKQQACDKRRFIRGLGVRGLGKRGPVDHEMRQTPHPAPSVIRLRMRPPPPHPENERNARVQECGCVRIVRLPEGHSVAVVTTMARRSGLSQHEIKSPKARKAGASSRINVSKLWIRAEGEDVEPRRRRGGGRRFGEDRNRGGGISWAAKRLLAAAATSRRNAVSQAAKIQNAQQMRIVIALTLAAKSTNPWS